MVSHILSKLLMTGSHQLILHLLPCVVLAVATFFPTGWWLSFQNSLHTMKDTDCYYNSIKQGNSMYIVQHKHSSFKKWKPIFSHTERTSVMCIVHITEITFLSIKIFLNHFHLKIFWAIYHKLSNMKKKKGYNERNALFSDLWVNEVNNP